MGDHVDAVRRYLAAFSSGDADRVAACVTDDFVNEQLGELGAGCVGRAEYRRRLTEFLAAFDPLHYEVVDVVDRRVERSDGDEGTVVVRYVMRSRSDGHPIEIPGVMWFEVRRGLIARRTDLWDSLSFLRQTGRAD